VLISRTRFGEEREHGHRGETEGDALRGGEPLTGGRDDADPVETVPVPDAMSPFDVWLARAERVAS
jgi:hypothetical protein